MQLKRLNESMEITRGQLFLSIVEEGDGFRTVSLTPLLARAWAKVLPSTHRFSGVHKVTMMGSL
jgi:hypothetical protein